MSEQFKHIIWAVDATQECDDLEMRCLEAIRTLIAGHPTKVEPVFIYPPLPASYSFELIYPPAEDYRSEAAENLKNRLKNITSPKLSPLKIFDKLLLSTAGAVSELTKYGEEIQADLIVVGTHCRKGIARLFLGSFAETLLLHSRTPLLMVGTHATEITNFEAILFPTDLGPCAEAVFPRVVDLAKRLKSKLDIYHMISRAARFEEARQTARRKLEVSQQLAKNARVAAEIIIEQAATSESETILAAAQARNSSLIAMAAHSGAVASTIVGSTTRQVVRGASCPVWVLHTHGMAQTLTFDITEEDVLSELVGHGHELESA